MQYIEETFWRQLRILQEEIVCNYVSRIEDGVSVDLYEITFDTLYSMLELIDGYRGSGSGFSLVDRKSGQVVNQDRFMHDRCEKYLCDKNSDHATQ